MKWIKYNVFQNRINVGTETSPVYKDILLEKEIVYCEENLAIAQEEAYKGVYTIEEKDDVPEKEPVAIELGGTGASNAKDARKNLEIHSLNSYFAFIAAQNADALDAAFGKNNEGVIFDIGKQMAMYAWFKGANKTNYPFTNLIEMSKLSDLNNPTYEEILANNFIHSLVKTSPYAADKVFTEYSCNLDTLGTITSNMDVSTNITVTDEDLTRKIYFTCSTYRRGGNFQVTLVIGDTTIFANDTGGYSDGGVKNWSEIGITKAGTYTIRLYNTNPNKLSWSGTASCNITKMKG